MVKIDKIVYRIWFSGVWNDILVYRRKVHV